MHDEISCFSEIIFCNIQLPVVLYAGSTVSALASFAYQLYEYCQHQL